MTLLLSAGGALRQYGTWGEQDYAYGAMTAEGKPLAIKRFTWTATVRAKQAPLDFTLSYFSDAFVDPRRMNELGYLAEQERKALDLLVQMVQAAVDGSGYIGIPNPGVEVQKDVVQLMREWVSHDGYPETWEPDLCRVIDQAFARLGVWKERLYAIQARQDPAHPTWGIAFDIVPLTPKEASL